MSRWPPLAVMLTVALVLFQTGCQRASQPKDPYFGIAPPYRLRHAGMFMDGGTIGGVIRGGGRDTLAFCQVRSFVGRTPPSDYLHIYVGAEHFRWSGARLLPGGSPAESSFIRILQAAVDAALPRRQQDSLRIAGATLSGDARLRGKSREHANQTDCALAVLWSVQSRDSLMARFSRPSRAP